MNYGDDDDDDGGQMRTSVLHRARTEGVLVALETALAVCRDPKATSAAKASACRTLFLAGGMISNVEEGKDKEGHQMTAEELQKNIDRLLARHRRTEENANDGDVFD